MNFNPSLHECISFIAAPVLNVIMAIFNPVLVVVTYSGNKVLFLIGVDVSKIKRPLMTEEEVQTCIKMGWDEGAITAEEDALKGRLSLIEGEDETCKN